MDLNDKPVVNPDLVFREEFDDWAILFDPDPARPRIGRDCVSALSRSKR